MSENESMSGKSSCKYMQNFTLGLNFNLKSFLISYVKLEVISFDFTKNMLTEFCDFPLPFNS